MRVVEKLRDVVGLYLDPPDKALVLCIDEKSQLQALERTQPLLPLGFGDVEGVTHDYTAPPPCSPRSITNPTAITRTSKIEMSLRPTR